VEPVDPAGDVKRGMGWTCDTRLRGAWRTVQWDA
jgi:hypothetical protein